MPFRTGRPEQFYRGDCVNGHHFEGWLNVPVHNTHPVDFEIHCPVPLCKQEMRFKRG